MSKLGSYRIQLRVEYPFAEAAKHAVYWQALGVSHVYCSPYLQATRGSAHGYDVVNHAAVNEELGGTAGRARLCEALTACGLQQLLDIVPNHMAIRGGHNAWWWDVLENGPSSRYSSYFDVEWRASEQERVLLPILGDQYGVELEAGKITLERTGSHLRVRYGEHSNPLAPRTLGVFLRPVAARLKHELFSFVADALAELPTPTAADSVNRRRRHRDKQTLQTLLEQLLGQPDIADAVDLHVARTNSSPDALHELLESQNYRLAHWRVSNYDLDYRRFFDVDSLVGLRVEEEEVHNATHALIQSWLADGSVNGLRVDHVDGLYDPRGYLDRLRAQTATGWLLVEKILEGEEQLPEWPVSGTTGYEFLNQAQRLLVDADGKQALTQLCTEFLGEAQDYEEVVRECKELVLQATLGSDVKRLVNRLADICNNHRRFRDYARSELEKLVREFCIALPVYRTYVHPERATTSQDLATIRQTCKYLREKQPSIDARLIDFFERLLLLEWRGEAEVDFVLRLQQLTGPVMAKGVEDTAFYRFVRLVALNEVGGDPSCFAHTCDEFHELMLRRQACYPEALNSTSTHDTKRSEDARARLLCLSELPALWGDTVKSWSTRVRANLKANAEIDAIDEYSLWQNLIAAWPIEQARMSAFVLKAAREAKRRTTWQAPDEAYEAALQAYLTAIYGSRELTAEIDGFVTTLEPGFTANALNQTLLKLMCPGVPDIYQGTELWDFSLVDPDNRRAVDYELRQSYLAPLDNADISTLWNTRADGRIKLHVLRSGLRLRAEKAHCFGAQGSYQALSAEGSQACRVLAFRRADDVVAVVSRLWCKHGDNFDGTSIILPAGTWRNVLTGTDGWQGTVAVGDLLRPLPCAMLVRTA
jgi:(1->4)-alpha-D-glucan 1-alpha-D-glucosylmutase